MAWRRHTAGGCVRTRAAAVLGVVAAIAVAAAPAGAANFPGGTATWTALGIGIPADGSIIARHTELHASSPPVSSTLTMSRRPLGGTYASELMFK